MTHMVIWHNNGDQLITKETCGFSEEYTDKSVDEVRAEYEADGITVYSIDVVERSCSDGNCG